MRKRLVILLIEQDDRGERNWPYQYGCLSQAPLTGRCYVAFATLALTAALATGCWNGSPNRSRTRGLSAGAEIAGCGGGRQGHPPSGLWHRHIRPALRLDGDPQSRYLDAVVDGVVTGGLYLSNGNPAGPPVRLQAGVVRGLQCARGKAFASGLPVVLAGDHNVVPTGPGIYNRPPGVTTPLLRPASLDAFAQLWEKGWCDAVCV